MNNDYKVGFVLELEGKPVEQGKLNLSEFVTDEDFCLALASQVLEALRADRKQ